MNKNSSIFRSLDQIATKGIAKEKKTLFVKKITVDMDAAHLSIIEQRLTTAGINSTQRSVVWEALELFAEKHGISWSNE